MPVKTSEKHPSLLQCVFFALLLIPAGGCRKQTPEPPLPATPTPVAAPVKARTQRDFERDKMAWLTRQTIEAARKAAPPDTIVDPNVIDFIARDTLHELRQDTAPTLEALEAEGRHLLEAGYDHPLLLRAMGRVLAECGKTSDAARVNDLALQGLAGQPYPKVQTCLAEGQLAAALRVLKGRPSPEARKHQHTALRALIAAIGAGEFTAAESPIAYRLLAETAGKISGDSPWKEVLEGLRDKSIDLWLTRMLQGAAAIEAAWKARGGEFAEKVTPEGWRGLAEHLAQARPPLTAAWRQHPERPEAATAMITVTMGEQPPRAGETVRTWFDRAVAAQFDYLPAYDALAWALRPRWHGSLEAMEKFGEECLATGRFETWVPLYYWVMLRGIGGEMPGDTWRTGYRRPGVRQKLLDLYLGLEPGFPAERGSLQAMAAITEAWCGNYETSRKLLAQLPPEADLDSEILGRPLLWDGMTREVFEAELDAFTGPQKDTLLKAEDMLLKGQTEPGLSLTEQALEASRANRATFIYLRDRIAVTRLPLKPGDFLDYAHGMTALYLATEYKALDVMKFLLDRGDDPRLRYDRTWSPLDVANNQGNKEAVNLLLERGAPVKGVADTAAPGNSSLMEALKQNNNPSVANLLIAQGADVKGTDTQGQTPLHLATRQRQTAAIRQLLQNGADPNAATTTGETPLHVACNEGAIECVRLLLDGGADVNRLAPAQWTPLILAVDRNYPSIVRLLLERGAKVNAATETGDTPLDIAVGHGSTEIVKMLLELGAKPNQSRNPRLTPLHNAICLDHPEIALMLIQKGADVNALGERDWRPLHMAVYHRQAVVIGELMDKGAQPDAVTTERATALQLAIGLKLPDIVQILLDKGASPKVTTPDNLNMLQVAQKVGDPRVIQIITERLARRPAAPAPTAIPAVPLK